MDAASTTTLYADRRQGILLVPQSRAHHLDQIMEETDFPTIILCPDSIDNPDKAIGFVAGYLQRASRK
jgi:hypothetical protein